jgi:excisionase family DNA binding protein
MPRLDEALPPDYSRIRQDPETFSSFRRRLKEMKMDQSQIVLTISEACSAGRFGRTFCYEAIAAGKLRAVKNGSRTLVLAADLKAFLENLPEVAPKS